MNIRNILIALPSVYLIVALVLMGGNRSPRLPTMSTVPNRVLMLAGQQPGVAPAIRGGFSAPVAAAPAAPARALTPAEAMIASSPAPSKPQGTPYKVNISSGLANRGSAPSAVDQDAC